MSDLAIARRKMVDGQVRPADVTDLRIIEAMTEIPREDFVPAAQRSIAYLDLDIDVGGAGKDRRYLIKPAVLARMLQAAEIVAGDRVLVVGCATGYSAAVISKLAAEVVAVDDSAELVTAAKAAMAQAGIGNVTVVAGAAAEGGAAHGPDAGSYDVIVLDGATEIVPVDLYAQLKPAGRLVGVFALKTPSRATLVTRSNSDFGSRALFDASAPVLPGFGKRAAFAF